MSPGSDSSHVNVPQPRRTLQIFPSHGEELFPSLRLLSNCWEADVLLGRALFAAEGWSRRSAAGSEPAFVLGQRRARCCWPGSAGPAVAAAVSAGAIVPCWCSAQRGRGSRDNASPVWVEACGYSGAVTGQSCQTRVAWTEGFWHLLFRSPSVAVSMFRGVLLRRRTSRATRGGSA